MFRLKKLHLVVVGIVIILISLFLIFYVLFIPRKSLCDSEKLFPPCGVTKTTTGDISVITGVLVSKYKKGDTFYFEMVTVDKNKKPYTFTFTNPPNFPQMIVNSIPTGNKLPIGKSERTLSIKDFYDLVNSKMPLRVFAYNPKKLTEVQIAKAPDNLRKCLSYQISVLEYLHNPSLIDGLNASYLRLKDGCEIVVANVSI